jgi:hypothetical protein
MPFLGGGSGLPPEQAEVLKKLAYDEQSDTIIADASLQVKPSTVYLGSAFGMSNAVQAVGFRLADGTDALCLVNRFDKDGGSYSNPKFFALGKSSMLDINLVDTQVMSEPVEVGYTTAGDNLTYSFMIKPAGAGRLRAQYWLGENDEGAPVVDFHVDITQDEVDSGQPVLVEPNFYVITGGSQLFVRFSGIPLKGNGTLPWFRSKVLPYKEVTINGHVEVITTAENDSEIFIGCKYIPDTTNGEIRRKVPIEFTSFFSVTDAKKNLSNTKKCIIDFTEFGQGLVEMQHPGDNLDFMYVENDGWYLVDYVASNIVRV